MTESWREYMHVGVVHFMAYPQATEPEALLAALAETCADEFFDVVEVKPYDSELNAKIKALADQAGMKIGVGVQPLLLGAKASLNDPDPAGRQQAVEIVCRGIDASYEMGARICACLSGPDPGNDAARAEQMDLLADSLAQCCRYAQEQARDYVVWVSLETFDDAIDKRCLIGPSSRAAELAAKVREHASNFGLTIDLSHLPLLAESPAESLGAVGDYLIHVHAGNCVRQDPSLQAYGDWHPRFGFPGGENDVPQLAEFLESLIYSGYFKSAVPTEKPVFSFEVKPLPGETPQILLANTKRAFLRAWSQIGG